MVGRPCVAIRNVVDDIAIQGVGAQGKVAEQLGSATRDVIDSLSMLQLPVHEKKLAYLISDAG
eukprot:5336245-Pyramimonas_sp.AAC.1